MRVVFITPVRLTYQTIEAMRCSTVLSGCRQDIRHLVRREAWTDGSSDEKYPAAKNSKGAPYTMWHEPISKTSVRDSNEDSDENK